MLKKIICALVMAVFTVVVFLPTASQAKLADGIYSIPYQVNNAGKDAPSVGNDYFIKPAKLTVQNGKMVAEMTVKNASWIVKLEGPNYKELSVNKEQDTRLFQFDVADLSAKTAVSMRVEIPHLEYYHSYTVDFVFDEAKATKTGDVAANKPETTTATTTPVTSPQTTTGTSASERVAQQQLAEQKAAEAKKSTTSVVTTPKTSTATSTATKPTTTATTAKPTTSTTTTSKTQVKNPQTSDPFPYIALSLLLVSAFFIIRLRKQTA